MLGNKLNYFSQQFFLPVRNNHWLVLGSRIGFVTKALCDLGQIASFQNTNQQKEATYNWGKKLCLKGLGNKCSFLFGLEHTIHSSGTVMIWLQSTHLFVEKV